MKSVAQVAHILVKTNILKNEILKHCDEWINHFSDLLIEMTTNFIEGLHKYTQINSLRYI